MLPEQLDPLAGKVQDREGRLEEVVEANAPGGDAAVLEQGHIGRLVGGERAGDEPGPERLLDLLLAALDAQPAQRDPDEVDQGAARLAVGAAQVLLVEVMLRPVEAPGKGVFLTGREPFAVPDLAQQRIFRRPRSNGFLPLAHVLRLVDPLALGADLDVGDRFEPFVFQPELDEIARWFRRGGWAVRRASAARAGEDVRVAVVEVPVVAEEIVDDELAFADVGSGARAAPSHLLVEDGAAHAPAEHQMQDLAAVEAGIEHAHADRDHRVELGLEFSDEGVGIGDVGGDDFGVAALVLGVQLVQVLGETRGVMLGDGEDDRLARTGLLAGGELPVLLPGETVELPHHETVRRLVGPPPLEGGRIVVLVVDVGALGRYLGDAGRETVRDEEFVAEGVLYRVAEVGLFRVALVEVVSVALDIGGRGCREPDVYGVEADERSLPGAVDRAVALVGDHEIEVAGGVFAGAADHRLEQRHRDLLLLPRRTGTQPVAGIRGEKVLDGFERLSGELLAVHEHEHPLDPTRLEQALQVEADEIGLARAGRQLDQETPPAKLQRVVEGAHGLALVGAHGAGLAPADVVFRDGDGGQRLAAGAHLHHALQVPAREEAGDGARIVVRVVPEIGGVAVGQEDERRPERLRVGKRLLLGDVRVEGIPLGLDDRQRAATPVVEDVVGAALRFGRRGEVEHGDELADHVQVVFGAGGEDEIAERGIGIQRFQPDLAVAPASVRGSGLRALVFLDRELAPQCGIGGSALPDEHEPALAAAAPVGAKQAMGAVRDGGLHRAATDARDEVVAREAHGSGHRRPTDLVAGRPYGPVGSESAGGSCQVVHGGVGLEGTGAGPIDPWTGSRGVRGIRRLDFGADHRLVAQVPAGPAQQIVDHDPRVRFGIAGGHRGFPRSLNP